MVLHYEDILFPYFGLELSLIDRNTESVLKLISGKSHFLCNAITIPLNLRDCSVFCDEMNALFRWNETKKSSQKSSCLKLST